MTQEYCHICASEKDVKRMCSACLKRTLDLNLISARLNEIIDEIGELQSNLPTAESVKLVSALLAEAKELRIQRKAIYQIAAGLLVDGKL